MSITSCCQCKTLSVAGKKRHYQILCPEAVNSCIRYATLCPGAIVENAVFHNYKLATEGISCGNTQRDHFSSGLRFVRYFSIYLPSAERTSNKNNTCWWRRALFKSNSSGFLNPESLKHVISHLSPLLANFSEMLLIIILKPKVLAFSQSFLNHQCVVLSAYLPNYNCKGWNDAPIPSKNSSIKIWNSLPTLLLHP